MVQKITLVCISLLAIATASSSCGTEDAPLTESEFCKRKAAKECEGVAAACNATTEVCEAKRRTECAAFITAVKAQPAERPFRPENVEACVNRAGEVYKKVLITPSDRDALNELCNRVFSGKRKQTEACTTSDYECDSALICDRSFATPRCAKPVVVMAAFCNNPGETCPAGKFCTGPAGERQCETRRAAGEVCDVATSPCVESLRCSTETNKCEAKAVAAAACTTDADCDAQVPYCDPFAKEGKSCGRGFEPSRYAPECADFGGNP